MNYNENENIEYSSTNLVDELSDDDEAIMIARPLVKKEKKARKEKTVKPVKKPASRRAAAERRTMSLLFGILAVGICLLCVSVMGMVGVVGGLQTQPVQTPAEQTTLAPVQNQQLQIPETTTASQAEAPETTTAAEQENTPASSAPQTDEQWLTFFNDAVNKLKTEAPEMTKSKQTKTADIQLSNTLGNAYVSAAKDKYLSDKVVETPIAKGDTAAAKANVSPDGEDYVSALTLADIKSISGTTDGDGNYVIKIDMNDVSNPDLQSSYGKIFQFMLVDDVMNTYAPDMGATVDRSNVELKYSKCYATATITPDGKVVSYETMVNANMILRNAKVKVINTDLDATLYSVTKYYNIKW